MGQVGAAHPVREAEIVAHERGRAGLAADHLALDNRYAEALRSSVHGCGQPRRAASHDSDIKRRPLPTGVESECGNDLNGRRPDKDPAIMEDGNRQRACPPGALEQCPTLG